LHARCRKALGWIIWDLSERCYGAVVGVVAPNEADKEERIALSDAVECGERGVVRVASKCGGVSGQMRCEGVFLLVIVECVCG
jgi:hypothetical protein